MILWFVTCAVRCVHKVSISRGTFDSFRLSALTLGQQTSDLSSQHALSTSNRAASRRHARTQYWAVGAVSWCARKSNTLYLLRIAAPASPDICSIWLPISWRNQNRSQRAIILYVCVYNVTQRAQRNTYTPKQLRLLALRGIRIDFAVHNTSIYWSRVCNRYELRDGGTIWRRRSDSTVCRRSCVRNVLGKCA